MMRNKSLLFIWGIFTFIFIGCITNENESFKLSGTFTEEDPGEYDLVQYTFGPGNAFKMINYDIEEGCIYWEGKGKFEIKEWKDYPYKSEIPDSLNNMNMHYLSITNVQIRERENLECIEDFGDFDDYPAATLPVRNLSNESFETFVDNSDIDSPSRWEKFVKN